MTMPERLAREALEKISRLGNDGKLSCEDYVRRADEIAVDALVRIEVAEAEVSA